jgi:hypothetical protein
MTRDRSTYVACLLDDFLTEEIVSEPIQHEGNDLQVGSKASAKFWFDGAWYLISIEQVEG